MTGCKSLYGKYERPQVNTSGLVRDAVSNTDTLAVTDTTSFANIPWRSVFTDPQLQSLISTCLTNNPDLLNAALNVDMAEAQLKAAKLAFLPGISFTPQGTIAPVGMPISLATSLPPSVPPRSRCFRPKTIRSLCRPSSSPMWPTCTTPC